MRDRAVLVTGSGGAIGSALCRAFAAAGYVVIGTDLPGIAPSEACQRHVPVDLDRFCREGAYRGESARLLAAALDGRPLAALVNNAAVQVVAPLGELTAEDWNATLNVNLLAPFFLVQSLLDELRAGRASVTNIASIHATRTKPGFAAYATSKAALCGLTRSMALDLAGSVRVNSISPAAIETPMLAAGLGGDESALAELARLHPVGRIGMPAEVAALAVFLASDDAAFITGADYALDGGIGNRLRDPG